MKRAPKATPFSGSALIYPRTGNFIGFVGNVGSRALLRDAMGEFRRQAQIPSCRRGLSAIVPGSVGQINAHSGSTAIRDHGN